MSNHIQNIALIGGTGQVGSHILKSLIDHDKKVTVLSRTESKSEISGHGVNVKKVNYDNDDEIVSALHGHDILIITLAARTTPRELEERLVRAAGKAGVKWIMPNHWGVDTIANEEFGNDVFLGPAKRKLVKVIEELGMKWMAITSGFWYEFSLHGGPERFGFDFKKKTCLLYDDGKTRFNTSTWDISGEAVAKLVSIPISGASPSLEDFKNRCVYISSFHITQKDMLESVERVTGENFQVSSRPSSELYKEGVQQMQNGNMMGFAQALYTRQFYKDDCGDYEKTRGLDNEKLGIKERLTLDEATKRALGMDLMGQM